MRRALAVVLVASLASSALAVDPALRKQAKDSVADKRADAARLLVKEDDAESAAVVAELLEDADPKVRDVAVLACREMKAPEAIDALARAAKSKDELTRRNAAAALGRTGAAAALPHLDALARGDSSATVRAEALDALWKFERNPDALATATAGASDPDPYVRAAAIEAAGRIGTDPARDLVVNAWKDADDGVRCVARMEMRFVARDEALLTLTAGVQDASWRVRAQTVDDALWLRDGPAMEALVALVADPVLRVSAAAHRALVALSGKEIGRDGELWKAWWKENAAAWKVPKKLAEGVKDPADPKATAARYHGNELASAAAAFVLDASGSMKRPISKSDARVRWDTARSEIDATIGALPDGFVANVVLFAKTPSAAFPAAQAVTRKVRDDLTQFVTRTSPAGAGDLLGGLLTALADEKIDTIWLLSDGDPSAGDMVIRERVRWAVRNRNRVRKVAIHCVGFGAQSTQEIAFLEDLARDSGGRAFFR